MPVNPPRTPYGLKSILWMAGGGLMLLIGGVGGARLAGPSLLDRVASREPSLQRVRTSAGLEIGRRSSGSRWPSAPLNSMIRSGPRAGGPLLRAGREEALGREREAQLWLALDALGRGFGALAERHEKAGKPEDRSGFDRWKLWARRGGGGPAEWALLETYEGWPRDASTRNGADRAGPPRDNPAPLDPN